MIKRRVLQADRHKFDGRVLIQLKDKDTGRVIKSSIGYNELSEANKTRAIHVAGKYLNDMSVYPMGKTLVTGADGLSLNSSNVRVAADMNKQRCVVLLNLENKTVGDKFINVFNENGTVALDDVVVGWVNSATDGGSNQYVGIVTDETPKQAIQVGLQGVEKQWYFDNNKGIGSITHVGVMCGFGDHTGVPFFGGFAPWQCMSKRNALTFFIPPGVNGLTTNSEIIVYNKVSNNETYTYKINLAFGTNEALNVDVSELFGFTPSSYNSAVHLIDSSHVAYCDGGSLQIVEYSDTGIPTLKATIGIGGDYRGIYELSGDTEYIYANTYRRNGAYDYNNIYKINKLDYSYTTINAVSSPIIGGIPSTWAGYEALLIVSAYANNKYYILNTLTYEMIICTDINDICGSIVGTLTYPGEGFSVFNSSKSSETMCVSKPTNIIDSDVTFSAKDNISSPSTVQSGPNYISNYLLWLNFGHYSNYYNIFELDSAIEKSDANTINGSYVDKLKT